MSTLTHFIAGERVSASGQTLQNINPSTGKAIGELGIGTQQEVDRAVRAAREAFEEGWADTPGATRRKLMLKLAALLSERVADVAPLIAEDMGMPSALAFGEVLFAAEWLEYYAGWADKFEGEVVPVSAAGVFDYTLREPLGVVGAIIPWNAPISVAGFKCAPALAAGNAVVFKPSELAPRPALKLTELAAEAGFPPGVVGCVTGDGTTGSALVEHPGVDAISFTGGTVNGRRVAEACARQLKRLTLELGGKSANIVFADADLDAAAMQAAVGCFLLTGQQCVAGSRLLVESSIHDEFVARVGDAAKTLAIGDASRLDVQIGPLVSAAALERVLEFVNVARSEAGGVTGGERLGGDLADGYFVSPAIVTGANNDMRVAREEIFGPVLCVIPFEETEQAIQIANDTPYGLAGGVWTNDLSKAHRVAKGVKAGTIWVNAWLALNPGAPFGGYKDSGLGREGGKEALGHFTQTKNVYMQLKT